MDPKKDVQVQTDSVSGGPSDEEVHSGEMVPTGVASNGNMIDEGLQRGLKRRHLQMIAFGGEFFEISHREQC